MAKYSVYLGAVGWGHKQWVCDFYPEDLPDSWQLAFYNTQFRCVYLLNSVWSSASSIEVHDWLRETREDFVFLLENPERPDEESLRLVRRFGERGVLAGDVDILWLEGAPDLRYLAKRIQQAQQGGTALYLLSRDASLTQLKQVSDLMEVLGV